MAWPVEYDWEVYAGDNFANFPRIFTRDDAVVDLTGATALMQFRVSSTSAVLTSMTESDGITLGGTAGTVEINLTGTKTALLTNRCIGDMEITESNGNVVTLYRVKVLLKTDVSR